jgi:Ca2+-binding EF-hand superfamily protein
MPSFEPFAAFQRIDRDFDNRISSLELLRFLRQLGIHDINEADCYTMINYFNNDQGHERGFLRYNDFL